MVGCCAGSCTSTRVSRRPEDRRNSRLRAIVNDVKGCKASGPQNRTLSRDNGLETNILRRFDGTSNVDRHLPHRLLFCFSAPVTYGSDHM